ncbi:hypothetical protein MERGE_001917 [Pneumocystis wakefieldiae]|uniref:Kynureninase n=1 Tax=Pneumocystis wakefieldiae TaxID=38082 RepID=A0A899FW63_9ASCO|nr:hypothetical protein MERGE_001917 [Pneumocystis wakefieldiae]
MDYEKVAIQNGFLSATTREFSDYLDKQDPLKDLRNEFELPVQKDKKDKLCIYMCGNSLGLLSKRIRVLINEELNVWAKRGVDGHFEHCYGREWVRIEETVREELARIVGGKKIEVVAMNSLTVNIHLLMASFYKPQGLKRKILIEDRSFSSDYYAIASHLSWHGLNPETEILIVSSLKGRYTLTTEYILQTIDKYANEIAMIFFSGVHYYTGQAFDISTITKYAKSKGIIVGWDLAHAIGNIELKLHDWEVDFAVWCTYKYLNSGPGGVGGVFVHEIYANNRLRLLGWWGNNLKTRFNINNQQFDSLYGASGFQISNPSVLNMVSLLGSLEVFSKVSMSSIRQKSILLTGYLEYLLLTLCPNIYFTIITPSDPEQRGAQLSLLFYKDFTQVIFDQLRANGVVVDLRKPDVIRVAPAPLYNTFGEVFDFGITYARQLRMLYNDSYILSKEIKMLLNRGNITNAIIKVRNHNQNVSCTVSWNHIIDYCMNNGRVNLAFKYFNEMKKRSHLPNSQTFTILLHGLSMNPKHPKSFSYAFHIYKSLWSPKYADLLNIIHTNAMLRVCAVTKQSQTAFKVFEEVSKSNFAADSITYTILFNILSRQNMNNMNVYHERQKLLKKVIEAWNMKGFVVDELLICSISLCFLRGKKREDYDFVFTLVERFFGIKRMIPPFQEKVDIFINGFNLNSSLSGSQYIKIGNKGLNIILLACLLLKKEEYGIEYWDFIIKNYDLVPNYINYYNYFRLLVCTKLKSTIDKVIENTIQKQVNLENNVILLYMKVCNKNRTQNDYIIAKTILKTAILHKMEINLYIIDLFLQIANNNLSKDDILELLNLLRQIDLKLLIFAINHIKNRHERNDAISAGTRICSNLIKYSKYLTKNEYKDIQILKDRVSEMQSL